MKTIGDIFANKRKKKGLSLDDIAKGTKIRREFVGAIEKGKWGALPDYAVLSGFIKNIAEFLGIDTDKALAIFKRDYKPRNLAINPKPDVQTKFAWSPKLTFIVGSILLAIGLLGYLGYQYYGSINPPELEVASPQDNMLVEGFEVVVAGSTSTDATITANNQPILVAGDGRFSETIEVAKDTQTVKVVATSRNGKVAEVVKNIQVQVPK